MTKAQIEKLVERWKDRLFLTGWTIRVEIYKHEFEENEDAKATCEAYPEYRMATLAFYPPFFKGDKKSFEDVIVHELCHCISWPLYELAVDLRNGHLVTERQIGRACENVTQWMTDLVLRK